MQNQRVVVVGVPVVHQPIPVIPPHVGPPDAAIPSHKVNALMLHVTFSGLFDSEVTNAAMLQFALTAPAQPNQLMEYSIGNEKHPQPADPQRQWHKHMYLKYARKVQMRDSRYATTFDMIGIGGRTLHPYVQSVGKTVADRARVIGYTQKDGDFICSPQLMNFDVEDACDPWAIKLLREPSVRAGMVMLMEEHPEVFFDKGQRIEAMLTKRLGIAATVAFKLSDFTKPPLDLSIAHVLRGKSHIGKTEFALAHFRYPVLVRRIEDLKNISLRTDGVVFDDIRFTHPDNTKKLNLTSEETVHLLDMNHASSTEARYKDAEIPAKMPRIFTTNRSCTSAFDHIFPPPETPAHQEAYDNRVRISDWLEDDLRRPQAAPPAQRQRVGP